jgi:muramidase (phage lysozyme)
MANIIDSLVVALGFDTSGMETGRKQVDDIFSRIDAAAGKSNKSVEAGAKKVTETIVKFRDGLVDLLVAFTATRSIKDFIDDITNADVAVGNLSRTTETAVGTISSLEGAAAASGGTAAGMASTIAGLQASAQQLAITGQSAALPFLRALHVQFKLNKDGAIDVADELIGLAAAAQRMGGGARAAALLRGAGITDEGTLNLLLQGPAAVAKFRKEIEAAGTPKQADITAARQRTEAWVVFNRALTTIGRNILSALTPALLALGKILTALMEKISGSPALMGALTTAFMFLAGAITVLSGALVLSGLRFALARSGIGLLLSMLWRLVALLGGALLSGLSELAAVVLPALGTAFAALGELILATPVGWLIAGVAALALGAYELIEHWGAVANFFKNLWGEIVGAFKWGAAELEKIPGVKWAMKKLGMDEGAAKPPGAASAPGQPSGSLADSAFGRLISSGEGNYNSVNLGKAGGGRSSTADLANMTVAEVMAAQASHQFNAAGRYQIIAPTLQAAVKALHLKGDEKFDKPTQDRIFEQFLVDQKNPALANFLSGKSNDLTAAMIAASKEWASVADPTTGQSHYAGVGNNRASISPDRLKAALLAARGHVHGAALAAVASNSTTNSSASHKHETDVNFNGGITINTRADDAKGIAQSIKPLLRNAALAAQSQGGPS